jgi:hypothetical protein
MAPGDAAGSRHRIASKQTHLKCEAIHHVGAAASLSTFTRHLCGLNREKTMTALLLAVGALFLAVVASVFIDQRPSGLERADEHAPSIDAITLAT